MQISFKQYRHPPNELVLKILEKFNIRRGSWTNSFFSFFETVEGERFLCRFYVAYEERRKRFKLCFDRPNYNKNFEELISEFNLRTGLSIHFLTSGAFKVKYLKTYYCDNLLYKLDIIFEENEDFNRIFLINTNFSKEKIKKIAFYYKRKN